MNDNVVEFPGGTGVPERRIYVFSFSVGYSGAIGATKTEEEVRKLLEDELTESYGPAGFQIEEFRLATTEEFEALMPRLPGFLGEDDASTEEAPATVH